MRPFPDPRRQPDGDRRHPHLRRATRTPTGVSLNGHRRPQPALRQVGAPPPHAGGVGGAQHDEGAGGHHLVERHALGRPHPPPLPRPPAPPREHAADHRLPGRGDAGPRAPRRGAHRCASTRARWRCWPRSRDLKGLSGHADAGGDAALALRGAGAAQRDLRDPRRGGRGRGPRGADRRGSAASATHVPRLGESVEPPTRAASRTREGAAPRHRRRRSCRTIAHCRGRKSSWRGSWAGPLRFVFLTNYPSQTPADLSNRMAGGGARDRLRSTSTPRPWPPPSS